MTHRSSWVDWLPGLHILNRYKAAWFLHDVVGGLVLATMLVPVGIAYTRRIGLLTKQTMLSR